MTEPHVVTTVQYSVDTPHVVTTTDTPTPVMGGSSSGETKHVYPVLSLYILNMDGLHFFESLTMTIVFI